MKLSYNWLKELTETKSTPEELGDKLTMLGFELEEIIDYRKIYDKFITAKVTKKESHPNADKLSLCTVEYGENSQVVVCGAPNVDAGQTIVLGLAGAKVPSAGFELSKRKIRGIESNGMICSKAELELGEDHSGIWVLPENAPIGVPLAEYIEMDDVMIDVFITPNRADGASHIGIAREIAAIESLELKIPKLIERDYSSQKRNVEIDIENKDSCPRYAGLILENIKVIESPSWLQNRLKVIGLRPRNLIVDATNFVMMECGNPLHAFDLKKLKGEKIIVKNATKDYTFTSLDNKKRVLDDEMLTINDSEKPVAIAGVMGGFNSEIDNSTSSILIESAYFDPKSVRKTSRKLSLQSDSSYRFERGVNYDSLEFAAKRCADIIIENGGGEIASKFTDIYPNKINKTIINVRFERARKIIGLDVSNDRILQLVEKLGWQINKKKDSFEVEPPSYRVDLDQEIDVIEEIARLYNYNQITPDYTSKIDFSGENLPHQLEMPKLRKDIRSFFVLNGFIETYSQNQTDKNTNSLFGGNDIELANPLGKELGFMRNSLIGSLMKIVSRNLNLKNSDLQIFQIGKTFHSYDSNKFIKNISENERLAIALVGKSIDHNWYSNEKDFDFFDIKGVVSDFLEFFHIPNSKFKNNSNLEVFSADSQNIFLKKQKIGTFGKINKKLKKYFDIEREVWVAEIELSKIYNLNIKEKKYAKVSQFPNVERDFAFVLDDSISSEKILNLIEQNAGNLFRNSYIFDIYRGKGIEEGKKSIALKLILGSDIKTLNDEEINSVTNKIIKALENKLKASLRD